MKSSYGLSTGADRHLSMFNQTKDRFKANTQANLFQQLNMTSQDSYETDPMQALEQLELRQVASIRY